MKLAADIKKLSTQFPKQILIVYSKSQKENLAIILNNLHKKVSPKTYLLNQEPDANELLAINTDYKLVIGIGGGSVLDAAKFLSLNLDSNNLSSYFHEDSQKFKMPKKQFKLVLIPTHFSSGAWASKTIVLTHNQHKKTIITKDLLADNILVYPNMLNSLSKEQIYAYAYDTLSHWLEIYTYIPKSENLWLYAYLGWLLDFYKALKELDYKKLFELSAFLYSGFVPLHLAKWDLHIEAHQIYSQTQSPHHLIIKELLLKRNLQIADAFTAKVFNDVLDLLG